MSASSSSHRHSRQNQHRSRRSAAWEDDAWKIDSDDEDFVKASKGITRTGSGHGQAAHKTSHSTASSPVEDFERLSLGRSSTNGKNDRTSSTQQTATRHAPPARPHPFPLGNEPPRSSSSSVHSYDEGQQRASPSSRQSMTSTNTRPDTSRGSASLASASTSSSGRWTLIGRSGSMSSARGASPGDETADALANEYAGYEPLTSEAGTEDEPPKLTAKEIARLPTRESLRIDMLRAVQDDIDSVVEDPTRLLDRLDSYGEGGDSSIADTSLGSNNAVVAIDGVLTELPVPAGHLQTSTLRGASARVSGEHGDEVSRINRERLKRRRAGFIKCLRSEVVNIDELRPLAWSGVPDDLRPIVWMLLLGYLPRNQSVRTSTLTRKRTEYRSSVKLAFQRGDASLDQAIWHQIRIDVPRTNPGILLWQREATQRSLERILYVWAIHHPASGYVQGINDLATPFFEVFLSAYIAMDPEVYDISLLPEEVLQAIEADTFWCLSKLLEGIQDNYTEQQLGIQSKVATMSELVSRMNPELHAHFREQNVEYMQIAFRWMNCLLMRELSVPNIVRLWDTYLADGSDAFSNFHVCVCAAFLNCWSSKLLKMDFQGIIMFLQGLPMQKWTPQQTEVLLADAFLIKSLFGGTAHLAKAT